MNKADIARRKQKHQNGLARNESERNSQRFVGETWVGSSSSPLTQPPEIGAQCLKRFEMRLKMVGTLWNPNMFADVNCRIGGFP
jgi:hypothetical protein